MSNSKGHQPVGYRRRSSDGAERSCWIKTYYVSIPHALLRYQSVQHSESNEDAAISGKWGAQVRGTEATNHVRLAGHEGLRWLCAQVSRVQSLYQHPRRVARVTWSTRRRPTNRPTEPAIRLHLIATVDSQRPRQTSPVLVEGRRTLCWCVSDTHYDSATRLVVQTALRNTVNRCAISCSE